MIRRLEVGDAEAFRALRLEGLFAHPTAFGADHADEAALPLEHFARRLEETHVIGGFVEGKLAAVIGLQFFQGRKLRHKGAIWGVYTRPEYRSRGLSRRLLDVAIDEARRQGLEWLKLSVSVENVAARRLYESRGFVIHGREPAALRASGVDHDEDLMSLRL